MRAQKRKQLVFYASKTAEKPWATRQRPALGRWDPLWVPSGIFTFDPTSSIEGRWDMADEASSPKPLMSGYSRGSARVEFPYRGLFPSPPLFDRMPTYRTQGKRSLNFLSALDLDGARDFGNGRLGLSFDGTGQVGGVDFEDEDVLEYDSVMDTWSLAYDGSVQHSALGGGPDLDAVSVPEPGRLLLLISGIAFLLLLGRRRLKR